MKASCIGVLRSLRMNQMSINHMERCFARSFIWENICSLKYHFSEGDFLRWNKNCFCIAAILNAVMKKGHQKPLKILVVEEDPEILNSLNIALASVGFDVDILQTAKPILQNQFVVPDLIIVDKRLPDIDGLEICKYLKSRPNYQQIPVIVLSSGSVITSKAMESGASCCVEKPFVMQELVKAINETLHLPGARL